MPPPLSPTPTHRMSNCVSQCLSWLALPLCGPCCYSAFVSAFEVPAGHVQPMEDGQGGYMIAGKGVHRIVSPFIKTAGDLFNYSEGCMVHGDWCLLVIEQGFVGLAMDKGQPVLLPPGFHQWKSTTLKFVKTIDLNLPVIYLGPYTLLTVDEGYCAVTQNNGHQEIKNGGEVHLLMHRNHKFEKFLSQKIQTDNLARIEVITADNVLMLADATVNWRIANPELAAKNAAETMKKQHTGDTGNQGDITKLRNDVLKQASASLSSFIGTVNYSDSFSPMALVHQEHPVTGVVADTATTAGGILFDTERMLTAVEHANAVTRKYGVEIISINIISAKPSDPVLMTSLAQGAVAAAEALQMETTAQGRSKAVRIEADANALARLTAARAEAGCVDVMAKAEAKADEVRATGSKQAADLLATSDVAVQLARIDRTGTAIGKGTSLFFGADPSNLGSLLSNPNAVSMK
eukprot:TRINITY_DN627_c0_g1_i5.p2 TRINITY_DN627_c0_g1~~TRINITY_DN627_c0_g1_i5.p2  ORF type:complete len:462 (+),score=205.05 TRINITY_DN627_c0_g1_i5:235-1620(+)